MNVTNISNMHQIANIRYYKNPHKFYKIERPRVIHCNIIFEWKYITYKKT